MKFAGSQNLRQIKVNKTFKQKDHSIEKALITFPTLLGSVKMDEHR